MALLEADVNFKVVKQFVNTVTERAIGQDVMKSLTPGQMVIKIVNEEMVALMGSETTEIALRKDGKPTVIMMAGLQPVRPQPPRRSPESSRKRAKDRCLSRATCTVRRRSNSFR